jgi:hypothetical protein
MVALCVIGLIVCGLFGIGLLVDAQPASIAFIAIAIVCGVSLYNLHGSDVQRQITANNFKETVGIVSEVSGNSVIIDKTEYNTVKEYSDIKLDNVRIGDIVKVRYLDADFGNYITKLSELDVKEKQ